MLGDNSARSVKRLQATVLVLLGVLLVVLAYFFLRFQHDQLNERYGRIDQASESTVATRGGETAGASTQGTGEQPAASGTSSTSTPAQTESSSPTSPAQSQAAAPPAAAPAPTSPPTPQPTPQPTPPAPSPSPPPPTPPSSPGTCVLNLVCLPGL